MRLAHLSLLLTLSVAHLAVAGPAPQRTWTHTRPLSPGAAALLADAAARAPVVRALLEELDRTDVVVYLTDKMTGQEGEPRAYLSFVSCAAGLRYLLVRINKWRLQPVDRPVWLGHELEHALEVAAAPDVKDAASLAVLYSHIGWEVKAGRYESEGAREVGNRVRTHRGGHHL